MAQCQRDARALQEYVQPRDDEQQQLVRLEAARIMAGMSRPDAAQLQGLATKVVQDAGSGR